MKYLIMAFFLFALFSCSGSEPEYSPIELYKMAMDYEAKLKKQGLLRKKSELEKVRMSDLNRPNCKNYPPGCMQEHALLYKVRRVEFKVLRYKNASLAREAAAEIDEFYARNWLFAGIKGEPVLEDFVKNAFGAINPKK